MSSNTYQVPGVYVQGTAASIVTAGTVPTTTVTIVADSRGYQLATETLVASNTPAPLAQRGVLPDDVAVDLKVTKVDGTLLVEDTDYQLVRGAGAADLTTINRKTSSTVLTIGELITVSYSYADASYYSPKTFSDFNSIEQVYGPALVNTAPASPDDTQVLSPLSLAARLAFENGAAQVICVALEPATMDFNRVARFNQAFTKTATNPDVTLLVPVISQLTGQNSSTYTATVASLLSAVRAHVTTAASAGYGRIAFVGADTLYDDSGTDFTEMAAAISSARVVEAFPNRMTMFNASVSQSTEVGGCYLAAAYAGRLAASAPNRGLTRLQVFGFTGIPADLAAEMDTNFKNNLSSSGVCVTEPGRTSELVVRHGVSTDDTDVITQEVSVTRGMDILFRLVSDGLDGAGLIGEPITDETTTAVKSVVAGILETALSDLVIAGYDNLLVRQQAADSGNPTVVEVQFTYAPFLPLNYITVTFSMDLTSGVVAIDDGTASAA